MWNVCKLVNVLFYYVMLYLNIYVYDMINLYCVVIIVVVDGFLKCCIIDVLMVEFFI